jgi:hypothetical protein
VHCVASLRRAQLGKAGPGDEDLGGVLMMIGGKMRRSFKACWRSTGLPSPRSAINLRKEMVDSIACRASSSVVRAPFTCRLSPAL